MGTLYKVAEGGAYRGHVGLRIILIDQLRSAKHDRTRNQLSRKVLTTGFPCVSAQAGPLTAVDTVFPEKSGKSKIFVDIFKIL